VKGMLFKNWSKMKRNEKKYVEFTICEASTETILLVRPYGCLKENNS